MGLAAAKQLAENATDLVIVGRSREKLDAARSELLSCGAEQVETIAADLYSEEGVDRLIERIEGLSRPISYLVNAAGYFKPVSFLDHTKTDYDAQLGLNRAFFFLTQAVARNMKANGGGSIVNIGSMWANQAVKATPSSAYSMQKAGLHSLTQHLAMELADFGIRVNAVAPAVVLSTIYKSFIDEGEIAETLQGFNDFHPIGRIGSVEDVANSVSFLLGEQAGWITGTVLDVDGGVMAGRNQ